MIRILIKSDLFTIDYIFKNRSKALRFAKAMLKLHLKNVMKYPYKGFMKVEFVNLNQ
jgi:hypothetical protein